MAVLVENEADVPLGPVDRIVLTTPLDRLTDALGLLRRVRRALSPQGTVRCTVANGTSAAALVQLLRSDPSHPRDAAHAVVHGYATAYQLLLEAGFSPDIVDRDAEPVDAGLMAAATPLLEHLRVDTERAGRHLGTTAYTFEATPITDLDEARDARPLTFAACVNDDAQLAHNLLASPLFGPDSPHQLLLYRGMTSAAEGLNRGIHDALHDLVVLVQQDIYLPSWWPARLWAQWAAANADGRLGVAGPFGVRYREGGREHVGHAVDRDTLLRERRPLPADVDGLDELVLVVPRDTTLRFAPALGWHLYGTDLVLQAREAGLRAAALDVPVHHNSLYSGLGPAYRHAEAVLATRWPRELPIVTNTTSIEEDPRDARMRDLEALAEHTGQEFNRLAADLDEAVAGGEAARAEAERLRQRVRVLRQKLRDARAKA